MKSRTLDKIDTAAAWVEGTQDRVTHWLRCHFSWAYRQHAYEETFTFTIAVTGRLRERARRLAVDRIRRDLREQGADGPFVRTDGTSWQIEQNGTMPDWYSELPPTGVVRIPRFNDDDIQHEHRATYRR